MLPHSGLADRWVVSSDSFQCWIQTIGPLARSTRDLSLLLQVMSGPDEFDSHAVPFARPTPADGVDPRHLVCAYFDGDGDTPVRADIRAVVTEAAQALRSRGLSVSSVRPPLVDAALDVFHALRDADGLADHRRVAAQC